MTVVINSINSLLEKRFLDYALSVITDRAIPSVQDGLKPVQRRILWAMYMLKLRNKEKTKKCAQIVGEVMGKYHPHGDASIYSALVRLAQEWILNAPLIHPQGNFGSIDDSNSCAAARYTEAKLSKIAEELLESVENEVSFIPTYSNEHDEPTILPAKFPNLLVNGAKGIAVGLATEIPPHNLGEVLNAQIEYIKNPSISLDKLMQFLPAPDFPTGGIIRGKSGIRDMYETGKGKFQIFCKFESESDKKGKDILIITELPYGVEKANLLNQINQAIRPQKDKKQKQVNKPLIEGIEKCVDRSGSSKARGFRIEILLKKGMSEAVIKNQLYKYTDAQVTYNANIVALDGKKPLTLGLLDILEKFHQFRRDCLTKKFEWEKEETEKKAHRLEGFVKVLSDIDKTVEIIKGSKTTEEASKKLKVYFKLSDEQAKDVLELQLRRLTSLEITKIKDDLAALKKRIEELKKILGDVKLLDKEILLELESIKPYVVDRQTERIDKEISDFDIEDIIEDEDCILTISKQGYVNRLPVEDYRLQRRGGKGSSSTNLVDDDYVSNVYTTTTKSYLFCFSNTGKLYWLKSHEIPLGKKGNRGKPIVNYLEDLKASESVISILPIADFEQSDELLFITKNGIVKKTKISLYKKLRKGGLSAIKLGENDSLKEVLLVNNKQDVIIGTQNGIGLRTSTSDIRPTGKSAKGVKIIKLSKGDKVIAAELVDDNTKSLLAVTANCFGKKTSLEEYRSQLRGGKGSRLIRLINDDYLVGLLMVEKEDNLLVISEKGQTICIKSGGIRNTHKATRGVRIIELVDDKIRSLTKLNSEEKDG